MALLVACLPSQVWLLSGALRCWGLLHPLESLQLLLFAIAVLARGAWRCCDPRSYVGWRTPTTVCLRACGLGLGALAMASQRLPGGAGQAGGGAAAPGSLLVGLVHVLCASGASSLLVLAWAFPVKLR